MGLESARQRDCKYIELEVTWSTMLYKGDKVFCNQAPPCSSLIFGEVFPGKSV
jgi:hypothetical protein